MRFRVDGRTARTALGTVNCIGGYSGTSTIRRRPVWRAGSIFGTRRTRRRGWGQGVSRRIRVRSFQGQLLGQPLLRERHPPRPRLVDDVGELEHLLPADRVERRRGVLTDDVV